MLETHVHVYRLWYLSKRDATIVTMRLNTGIDVSKPDSLLNQVIQLTNKGEKDPDVSPSVSVSNVERLVELVAD